MIVIRGLECGVICLHSVVGKFFFFFLGGGIVGACRWGETSRLMVASVYILIVNSVSKLSVSLCKGLVGVLFAVFTVLRVSVISLRVVGEGNKPQENSASGASHAKLGVG